MTSPSKQASRWGNVRSPEAILRQHRVRGNTIHSVNLPKRSAKMDAGIAMAAINAKEPVGH